MHPQIVNFVHKEYRHSLFVKCQWGFDFILQSQRERGAPSKSYLVLYQVKNMIRADEQCSLRERRNLKKKLMVGLIESFDYEELSRVGQEPSVMEFWLWANKNFLECKVVK